MTQTSLPADHLRALALAVDGTVLTDEQRLTHLTVQAVGMVRRAGIRVILVSARQPQQLHDVQRLLGIEDEVFVACQGALVARRTPDGGYATLCEARIDSEKALSLEERAFEQGLSVGRFIGDRWLFCRIDQPIEEQADSSGTAPEAITGDCLRPELSPHKLVVACGRDEDPAVLHRFRRNLPFSTRGAFSQPNRLEVTDYQIDKVSGLGAALAGFGVHLNEVAGIGAGDNDIPMLRAVGYSFAMDNASPEVRAAATWVTWRHVDDGVAWAIDQLLPHAGSHRQPSSY
jgi:Cof subfamily protein (haloacid dehalogenase superfamily)